MRDAPIFPRRSQSRGKIWLAPERTLTKPRGYVDKPESDLRRALAEGKGRTGPSWDCVQRPGNAALGGCSQEGTLVMGGSIGQCESRRKEPYLWSKTGIPVVLQYPKWGGCRVNRTVPTDMRVSAGVDRQAGGGVSLRNLKIGLVKVADPATVCGRTSNSFARLSRRSGHPQYLDKSG